MANSPPHPQTITFRATRRIQFCAGHRVFEHGSKCRHLHGHNYVAFVTAQAAQLDNLGMVIDFSVLKDVVGRWIEQNWDHGFIYLQGDSAARHALDEFQREEGGSFQQKRFPLPYNPTAENMAQFLLETSNNLLKGKGVLVTDVTLWETENCYATATLPDAVKVPLSDLILR